MNAIAHDFVRIDGADLYGSKRHLADAGQTKLLAPDQSFKTGVFSHQYGHDLVAVRHVLDNSPKSIVASTYVVGAWDARLDTHSMPLAIAISTPT